MSKKRETAPHIPIDDLHPKHDKRVQLFKATWQKAGVIVTLWLDEVDRSNWQPGHYVRNAYELTSHIETVSGRPLGPIQEETGLLIVREFRAQMLAAMTDAGWQQVDSTNKGRPIYQYRPGPRLRRDLAASVAKVESDLLDVAPAGVGAGGEQHQVELRDTGWEDQLKLEQRRSHLVEVVGSDEAKERGQQPAYSRQVWTRPITFPCLVCGKIVTQQRYPGHTPLYCSDSCKDERLREKTRERVARHRKKKKAESGNDHSQESVTS